MVYYITNGGELYHHGIKGQKWGVRRYQNPDGSLTDAGRKRQAKKYAKELNKLDDEAVGHISRYMRYDAKVRNLSKKGSKVIDKYLDGDDNMSDKQVAKTAAKVKAIEKKIDDAYKLRNAELDAAHEIDSNTWKIVGNAVKEGYNVDMKKVVKMPQTETGKFTLTQALTGVAGQSARAAVQIVQFYRDYKGKYTTTLDNGRVVDQAPWAVQGVKFKVKAKKDD